VHGESPGADERFADRHDLIALLDALEVTRVTVVGASRGGRIAIDAALDAPARIVGLVTVGSTPGSKNAGSLFSHAKCPARSSCPFHANGRPAAAAAR